MQYIVITGASSGIGYATAGLLVQSGFHVFGSVRTKADADRLTGEFGQAFTPLIFDIVDDDAIIKAAAKVQKLIGDNGLFGLVNNAGIAVAGPLEHLSLDKIRHQFDVNFFGLLAMTKAFLPMIQISDKEMGRPGRIVNISSINGVFAAPFLAPYAATKHALEAITDSLRRELFVKGVDVIAIAPGVIDTPIWQKAEQSDRTPYSGTAYGDYLEKIFAHARHQTRNAQSPDLVARIIHKALTKKRPKARYAIVKSMYYEGPQVRMLPKRLVDSLIKLQFKPKLQQKKT